MAVAGSFSFTITSGTPSAVTASGGTLSDGTYSINVEQDNTGVSIDCTTPYGDVGDTGTQKGDASE